MAIPTSGAYGYALYGWEAIAYGTEAVTKDKVFGYAQDVKVSPKNNFIKIRGLGDRDIQSVKPGVFDGSGTVTFAWSNPWIFKAFFGAATDGGTTPKTHTWNTVAALPVPFSTICSVDTDTDSNRVLLGCYAEKLTLSAAVGEEVKGSLDFKYKTETEDTTLDTKATDAAYDIFYFQEGSITIGSAVGYIKNFELTITQNLIPLENVGSRLRSNYSFGDRDFELSMTVDWNGPVHLDMFYGANGAPSDDDISAQSTAVITLNNGLATTYVRSLVITLNNLYFDSEDLAMRGNELISEDLTAFCKSFTSIVASDNTTTSV